MNNHTTTIGAVGAAGPYLDLTAALVPKKSRQKNLTRDQWVARAYNAEAHVQRLEAELAALRARPVVREKFFDYRFTAGAAVGWIVSWIVNALLFPK